MNWKKMPLRPGGFTMIELLLSLTAISILAAVMIPVVTQQLSRAQAARLVADLASLESAISTFGLDVRTGYPGRLEHLTNELTPASPDHTLVDGRTYSYEDAERWGGPYLDRPLEDLVGDFEIAAGSGSDSGILNGLTCYDPDANVDTGSLCTGGTQFVAIRIAGLDQVEFDRVSTLLDGVPNNMEGEVRYDTATGLTYYLALPYVP